MSDSNLNSLRDLLQMARELYSTSDHCSVGLLLGELQGLDKINGRLGYAAGDTAIDIFQKKLASIAREGDIAIRLGGSSFALLIRDPMHEGHALLAAEKISRLAEEWIVIANTRLHLDVNIGVSLMPSSAGSPEALLNQAEAAKNRCRECGERFILWRPEIDGKIGTVTHPLFDAKRAIDNGEFRLHYQPKVNLQTGATIGAEVLVRWQSKDGLVMPSNFLSEIERARAMLPLLQFVANNSSREMAGWVRKAPDFCIAINANTTDIEDNDLADMLAGVLGMWELEPRHLILEVTETSLMKDVDIGIETLRRLRDMGIRTSIDDFGTGYSSLAYLRELPVDEIKIDRSFVMRILDDERDKQIVESLIVLAQAMNLQVVAEGIETQAVAAALADMGCDIGQGYYFGHPVSAADFEKAWFSEATEQSPLETSPA